MVVEDYGRAAPAHGVAIGIGPRGGTWALDPYELFSAIETLKKGQQLKTCVGALADQLACTAAVLCEDVPEAEDLDDEIAEAMKAEIRRSWDILQKLMPELQDDAQQSPNH